MLTSTLVSYAEGPVPSTPPTPKGTPQPLVLGSALIACNTSLLQGQQCKLLLLPDQAANTLQSLQQRSRSSTASVSC